MKYFYEDEADDNESQGGGLDNVDRDWSGDEGQPDEEQDDNQENNSDNRRDKKNDKDGDKGKEEKKIRW